MCYIRLFINDFMHLTAIYPLFCTKHDTQLELPLYFNNLRPILAYLRPYNPYVFRA